MRRIQARLERMTSGCSATTLKRTEMEKRREERREKARSRMEALKDSYFNIF